MNDNNYEKELTAFEIITSALKNLDKSSISKILNMVNTFFNVSPNISTKSIAIKSDAKIVKYSEDRSLTPKEFLMEKLPKTQVERVACLAYYLAHYRDMQYFKTLDISKLNTEAAQQKLSNPAKAVDNATRYGYLATATKGKKQLSANGEVFIGKLPDREAAREYAKNFFSKAKKTKRIAK